MNKSRKIMSLLLVLALALPMVFSLSALAEEPVATLTLDVVATSGGALNVWPQPVKTPKTAVGSIANGKEVSLTGAKTYSTADKVWMVEISAPKAGWVDAKYIGKKTVVAKTYVEEGTEQVEKEYDGVAKTTGGKLNIWANPNFTGKVLTVENGAALGRIVPVAGKNYSKVYNEDGFLGYVRNQYVAKKAAPAKGPEYKNSYEKAKVVGTASNSIINLWGDKLNAKGEKPIMQLPLGHVFEWTDNWSNGWSEVCFETADEEYVYGWVQTKWLANQGEIIVFDYPI